MRKNGIRDTGYKIQNTGYGIRDTKYKIQNTKYGIRDTGYGIRDTFFPLPVPRFPYPSAFTLIELMLVVIIISVLAAMITPRLSGRSEQARQSVAKTDIEAGLSLALDLYEMDNGSYPQSLDALKSKPAGVDRWKGPYIKKKPTDPWGRTYIYKFPGEHNPDSYDLYSLGGDNKAGTKDDVVNWE